MGHYYDYDKSLKKEPKLLQFSFKGLNLKFYSDNGVFSKNEIDFGSRLLINSFVPSGKTLLDVGSGYGTLGISLKAKYGLEVTMVDINERAIELTNKNLELNNLKALALHSNLYEKIDGSYDQIISNPPIRAGKDVVHEILTKAYDHLNENGELWIVIQKKQGAPSAIKKLEEVFGNHEVVNKDKGYYIIKSIKNKENPNFTK